jgi:hypothetical protein
MPDDTIVLLHGRSTKPEKRDLARFWWGALRAGLERDHRRVLPRFRATKREFVYYGDISNDFLDPGHDTAADAASRRVTQRALKAWKADQFTRANYNRLPGKTSMKEFLADTFGGIAAALRISQPLIHLVAPDMREYWNRESDYGSRLRYRAMGPMKRALGRDGRVLVIAHSLGSIIAYDTLWKFSRTAEYRDGFEDKSVDLLITIGSPLGDETVKGRLRGSSQRGPRRYPGNVRRWINIAAEDDFISHDQRLRNDYAEMAEFGLTPPVRDERVYNLSVRNDASNPHHSSGYLIHPKMATIVASWLRRR